MAEEKQPASRLAAARESQAQQPQAADRTSSPASDREVELAQLQNENLRLQLQIAETNKRASELNVAAAEKNNRDVMEEAQRKEEALVARLKVEREAAVRWLQDGPRKFWVHLAHQLPVGTTLDNPVLMVGGESEYDVWEKYKTKLGILHTSHVPAIVPAVEGEPCPVAEILAKAENGYRPEMV